VRTDIPASTFLECILGRETGTAFTDHPSQAARERGPLRERVELQNAFCTLKRIDTGSVANKPRVLLVAPLAGQYATLLVDTVAGLISEHDVYVTDWIDARLVPVAEGKFDFEDNIAYVMEFIRALGPDLHVLALCQSAVPALAAVALLAAAADPMLPLSMILMGGLTDTRINPTRMNRLARRLSLPWLESTVITKVPHGYPGCQRRVYPASAQRAGLLMYLARRVEYLPGVLPRFRVYGDKALADPEFCKRLLTLMDLPAELFLQNIELVLQQQALARGAMIWRGQEVRPDAVERTALMTVEGEFDDISGHGQTLAAHELCRSIPNGRRCHHEQAGVGHFGMFAGPRWFDEVAPRVREFIRAQGVLGS
jgi:poly(3-hydroxybutyrate) depolymerase